jgi:ABC-type oligopeptide transport system substrate-binding subunit
LLQEDFRKALSLGLDRDTYAKTTTTAFLAGFGLFNSMHYYDVANGKAYRESDAAKKVLCEVYGVNPDDYASLDAAVDAITGYDLVQAKALVNSAYDKAVAAGDLAPTDTVVLTYGTSVDNESTRRHYETLKGQWLKLMEGTKLEGKFDVDFDASFGDEWADDFRAGAYDICEGGWTGAAWDPGYFLLAYLGDDYRYASEWDPSVEMLEFTMKGVNEDGEITNEATDSYTDTMSLADWYEVLNGEWQSGALNEEFRLELIAAIEKAILLEYYTVPVMYEFGASLISFQADYITYEYNTFMGYGGIQYMSYNYDDAAWAAYVAEHAVNGELNYK